MSEGAVGGYGGCSYETKSTVRHRGEIAASVSADEGFTWTSLGVVLEEPWHLSYPFVFSFQDQVRFILTPFSSPQ